MRFPIAFLFFLLLSFDANAAQVNFTTVFYDDGGMVYVGLTRVKGTKKESQVITFPFEGGNRVRIPLPAEIEDRDVVGLIPEKQKVFVLTHKSEGPKDGPILHVFDRDSGNWKKLGQLACPSFTKVNLSATKMVFFCETPASVDSRGRRRGRSIVPKTISYGRERLYRQGTWRFPEFMLRYKGSFLLLEGKAPAWERLRLKSNDGSERVLQADELFQLPVPNVLPSAIPVSSPADSQGD
jgi:hypothetical protein